MIKRPAEPRPYLPRLDPEVDEAIQKHNIHLPTDPYWWDIVDKMFDIGQYHIAGLAQPCCSDFERFCYGIAPSPDQRPS